MEIRNTVQGEKQIEAMQCKQMQEMRPKNIQQVENGFRQRDMLIQNSNSFRYGNGSARVV